MNKQKIIINIGRQIGSGGYIVVEKLSQYFQIPLHDKEILNLAAKESGFSEKLFEENDENKGFFKTIASFRGLNLNSGGFYNNGLSEEKLFQFQSDAIKKAATDEGGIFVGRAADYVLRDYNNVVNIFITAHFEDRVSNIMKRRDCSRKEAENFIESKEHERASFYNFYTGKKWGSATSYDLCVNTSVLGLDKSTELIACFIKSALHI